MKRVVVFKNGSHERGKAVKVENSVDELLTQIREILGSSEYQLLYTLNGGEINDVDILRDDEAVFASKGEAFLSPSPNGSLTEMQLSQATGQSSTATDWIKLNVGGQLFHTSRTTLLNREPESMLAKMFDPDSKMQPSSVDCSGAFLIDRDPKYFRPLLNFLRDGQLIIDPDINAKGVLEEAYFFGIQSCIPVLESMIICKDEAPLTRRDVINALITTSNKDTLRFQGVNLNKADLSYLDLRNINFKYAKLRNAKLSFSNLSYCNFERADMSEVQMNNAILSGVRMVCATLEGANCRNCNFQDPTGQNANLEGVNLKNALLEDSDMSCVNLRVACLKSANLKACQLRGAILAGADLAKCDLSGSDLHEANLRGANLKDASMISLIAPLHMAQAIR